MNSVVKALRYKIEAQEVRLGILKDRLINKEEIERELLLLSSYIEYRSLCKDFAKYKSDKEKLGEL